MATILPPKGGFGANLGSALGGGLGNIFEALGQRSARRKQGQQLQESGLPAILSQLDPQAQAAYLKQYGAAQQLAQGQQAEQQRQNFLENLKSGLSGVEESPVSPMEDRMGAPVAPGAPEDQMMQQMQPEQAQPQQPKRENYRTREARLSTENERLEQALQDPRFSAAQKAQISKEIEENETRLQKVREHREKKFGKELGALRTDYLNAKDFSQDLDRLKELEAEGLSSTKLEAFLDGAGLDISALRNPQSEEFQKIVANQTRNIKQYFGGRISNFEVQTFLKTLPSLMNSPEGRKRVVAQLDRLNNMKVASYDVAKKIIDKNKGIAPDNLWDQVDTKLEKKRHSITEQFKKDLKRKVPEGESKLAIGASYAAGKAAPILGGAALGGAVGGPLGGLLGGAAGAIGPSILNTLSRLGGGS